MLNALDAEIIFFENNAFGAYHPHGNKIECLAHIPNDVPFVFFDTDTLILDELMDVPFDFDRPSASNKVEGAGLKLNFMAQDTRKFGNRFMIASGLIRKLDGSVAA